MNSELLPRRSRLASRAEGDLDGQRNQPSQVVVVYTWRWRDVKDRLATYLAEVDRANIDHYVWDKLDSMQQ